MPRWSLSILIMISLNVASGAAPAAEGDPKNGARVFRACVACHTLMPGEHRTGPSLAGVWGRKAGTAPGFTRYSPALEHANVVWDATTLDAWLADPARFVPDNRMTFRLEDPQARADLIAYLEQASEGGQAGQGQAPGGMGGMMGSREMADLRHDVGPNNRVASIRYCGDTYTVGVASGESHQFWEFNLRFKTDSTDKGPEPGHPVLIPASMMGDRVFVIFADPAEISRLIEKRC